MAQPVVLARFTSLADAMQRAVSVADNMEFQATPQILAILDRDDRLVLAGVATSGAIAWCHPAQSAAEARAVVMEASALRAQRLEARLVDPLWRAFAARPLQIAA